MIEILINSKSLIRILNGILINDLQFFFLSQVLRLAISLFIDLVLQSGVARAALFLDHLHDRAEAAVLLQHTNELAVLIVDGVEHILDALGHLLLLGRIVVHDVFDDGLRLGVLVSQVMHAEQVLLRELGRRSLILGLDYQDVLMVSPRIHLLPHLIFFQIDPPTNLAKIVN